MADNKFIQRLKGQQTPKSVVEVQNDKLIAPFTGVPYSADVVGGIIDDKDSSIVVAKGAQNWKLDGNSLVVTSSLSGDGADYTGEFNASGSGLWINATYSLPDTIFNAGTKWVLKLCGKNLLTTSGGTIGFTLVVKVGNTHITSKAFTVAEGANVFCRQLSIDFSESEQTVIKAQSGDNLTVQLLCSDANASATIYNGMTVLTALQRRIDGDAVVSDKYTFDELSEDLATHIANKNNPHQVTKTQVGLGNCDNTSDLDKPISTATQNALDSKVDKSGDTMTGALNILRDVSSNIPLIIIGNGGTTSRRWNFLPSYNAASMSVYPGSTETNGFRFSSTGFVPASNNARYLGSASLKWKGVYAGALNNGADLVVPNKAGTLATMADVELAAQSGTQLYSTGVWYAKMYKGTVVPSGAEYDGRNYADFSQGDKDGNPIIIIYEGRAGNWAEVTRITPPAEYDGYITVTSKIWGIAEQTGQQGGRVLWNHTDGTFTPYPLIVSFEDINVTGNSTVVMPQNPGANQIVNKDYVDDAIAAIPTPTVDVTQSIDAEIVGTPTISDGDVSNLSYQNYLTLPGKFDVMTGVSSFEIVVAFTTYASAISNQNILGRQGSGGIAIKVNSMNISFRATQSVSETQNLTGVTTLSPNTKYYAKVEYDGTNYTLSISTDGVTYTQEATAVATYLPGEIGMAFPLTAGWQENSSSWGLGAIHMDAWYVKKNGVLVWQGMDAPGLHQRVAKGHEVIAFQAPTSTNNYTWYRKYADGWVEQGGTVDVSSFAANTSQTIALPITMAQTQYHVNLTEFTNGTDISNENEPFVYSKTTANFVWRHTSFGGNAQTMGIMWEVKGMSA